MESIIGALSSFNPLIAILILGAYIVIDALYAKYTLDIANYNEYRAATVGSIIHFVSYLE